MALIRLKDIKHNHQNSNDNDKFSFDSFSVYTTTDDEKVGSVKDALVDENGGMFRYLIVDTGPWVLGKSILLPIGLARFDYNDERVYVDGLTKEQVKNLPEFNDDLKIDEDYEERVRGVYRPLTANWSTQSMSNQVFDRSAYSYDQDPYLYNRNVDDSDRLRLYEQRFNRSRTPQ
ncbi:MAG TPA: PRC-barrel domain-containing protein [Crinalium sp.]|jgi:hypothetical protein